MLLKQINWIRGWRFLLLFLGVVSLGSIFAVSHHYSSQALERSVRLLMEVLP